MPIPRYSDDGAGWKYLRDSGRRMRRAQAVTSSTSRPQDQRTNPDGEKSTRTDLSTDAGLEAFLGRARAGGVATSLSPRELRAVLDTLAQAIAAGDTPALGAQLQLPGGFFPDGR